MPHCIIDYSEKLFEPNTVSELLHHVFDAMATSQLFDVKTIKVRARPFDYYLSATAHSSFIAVTIKILEGRTALEKQRLATSVLDSILSREVHCGAVSFEVMDIQAASYVKVE